jgi:uncharacterized protein
MIRSPLAVLGEGSVARPRLTLVVCLAMVGLLATALGRFNISPSLKTMLGTSSPAAQGLHRVGQAYHASEGLLVIIDTPLGRGADAAALRLAADRFCEAVLRDAVTRSLTASATFRPDPDLKAFIRDRVVPAAPYFLGADTAREFVARFDPDRLAAQFTRNEALIAAPGPAGSALADAVLRDPLRLVELLPEGVGHAAVVDQGPAAAELSHDGRAVLVRITPSFTPDDLDSAAALYDGVLRLTSAAAPMQVRIGGPCAIAAVSSRTIRGDAIVSTCASVALILLLFVVFWRAWLAPLLIGATAAAGMACGFGVYALIWPEISPLAAAVAALLAGLGVDYGTHLAVHFDNLRAQGRPIGECATRSIHETWAPITTNCFTSIFGFASLWVSGIPMLSDFARLGAFGLGGCLLASFSLLPALLVLIHGSSRSLPRPPRFGPVADFIARRPKRWIAATFAALAVLLTAAGIRGFLPRMEGDLTVLQPQPNPALAASDEAVGRFSGLGEVMPVLVRMEDGGSLISRAADTAGALMSDVCRRAGVAGVLGVHMLAPDPRTVPVVRDVLGSIDPARAIADFDAALAGSAFEAAAYTEYRRLLDQMLRLREPPTMDDVLAHPGVAGRVLPRDAGPAPLETLLIVRLDRTLRDRESRSAAVDAMRRAIAGLPGVTLAGLPAVSEELEAATRAELPRTLAISAALVFMWLVATVRRFTDVALAMIPLAAASLGTLALIVALDLGLNPINCVAVPLLNGIAVDAGVFLVAAARGEGDRAAVVRAIRPTTHAVLLAVATTFAGFAAFTLTHTPAIQSLGAVAAAGVLLSAVGAIGVLIPLLILRRRV